MPTKHFTVINEAFICQHCKADNPTLAGSCRNHCTQCLCSLHVDEKFPGDRKSSCHGLMKPSQVTHNSKKGWMITHLCTRCTRKNLNKAASDDNYELLIQLSQPTRTSHASGR